ncbi:hypothetical protein PHYBLDRAFT_70387 [Phycomyces blakesleeanus NRRL 1555(-)]|uniref:Uncharacterized protein n=1 Tax=Phycomyces blakesleeanus (strain ATCC 8743b / DSM 1359 / FGSC 10004 / NBRC 33097 / NRRL 1555) TaxID=763407 RepID=A0A167K0S9_PHYB8|nr:hypothetical protein PHYBLDRAFT_70387 [Phycomyces blakesleeanus NRRL 1555(-)]OAD67029.1 hypothetical protein PHYBLDRAFT_70387 [Phycomyces blakesleeanus NRRL 1555(-)]|eukprot:XP_018285069.1 hypothetical protein PHYBLDRAFT_70387 [Phycomyces blakesleeanus NRRL 1555(-)]
MAVNAMLEATVRRQASQVAQLKKQLKLNQANGHEEIALLVEPQKQELADLSEDEWEKDKVFQRLCHLTDKMLEQAQAAVVFEFKSLGRVITHYEDVDIDIDVDKEQSDIPEYDDVNGNTNTNTNTSVDADDDIDNEYKQEPDTPVVDKPCTDKPRIDIPPILLTESPTTVKSSHSKERNGRAPRLPSNSSSFHKDSNTLDPRKPHSSSTSSLTLSSAPTKKKIPTLKKRPGTLK